MNLSLGGLAGWISLTIRSGVLGVFEDYKIPFLVFWLVVPGQLLLHLKHGMACLLETFGAVSASGFM